jgi:ABC-type nitrate/sulfonate/bicarbonate transport system permease component
MRAGTRSPERQRLWLGLSSVAAMAALYTLASNAHLLLDVSTLPGPLSHLLRPEVLPPTQRLLGTLVRLVAAPEAPAGAAHTHAIDHLGGLVQEQVTLQGSLLASTLRVLVGLAVGAPLGILAGLLMGWSRRVDEYCASRLHSLPLDPLALITYVMLWLGHGRPHLLVPIVYAVFTTLVIPTYHGVRDMAEVYARAAQALGARGWLLFGRVVLPAASPLVLTGLRYALLVAWMTTVGAEMLMADSGMGRLLVGGGMWSSRLEIRVDPAVVLVGIAGLATAGYVMDTAIRLAAGRLTRWVRR